MVAAAAAAAAAAAICDAAVPSSLKAAQLQRVAFLCGLAISGTKADIRKRIVEAANTSMLVPSKASPPRGAGTGNYRVLSIDLGLRNLAYSLLTPVAPTAATTTAATTTIRKTKAKTKAKAPPPPSPPHPPQAPPPIHLHAWKRTSLVDASPSSSSSSPSTKEQERQTDAFSPAALAVMAVRLVRQTLLPLKPTHVLVERQRFRTHGAAPVLEWTLRVNTLEAMIHAAFRTLRECGHWDGEVVSVASNRVGSFWLDGSSSGSDSGSSSPPKSRRGRKAKEVEEKEGEEEEKMVVVMEDGVEEEEEKEVGSKEKKAKKKTRSQTVKLNMKKEKIDILGNWLEGGNVVLPRHPSAEAMLQTYLQHWRRKPHARKPKVRAEGEGGEEEVVKKIDDLADSLLQGLAWIKWEENKATLKSEEGVMRMLGL